MIEETGVVVSVRGELAEIEAERRGACGDCSVNGVCGTSLLARYFDGKRLRLRAHNAIGAGPGEHVVIAISEGALLEASFALYLVPLLALIGGGMAGAYIADLVTPTYTQALSVLGGLGGLGAALGWLVALSRAKASDERYQPRILRRAGRAPDKWEVHVDTVQPFAKNSVDSA